VFVYALIIGKEVQNMWK